MSLVKLPNSVYSPILLKVCRTEADRFSDDLAVLGEGGGHLLQGLLESLVSGLAAAVNLVSGFWALF